MFSVMFFGELALAECAIKVIVKGLSISEKQRVCFYPVFSVETDE